MQGRLDSPLTREGTEQAHAHGKLLKRLAPIEQMFVSPSGRTRETAYIVNSYVRARVDYHDALLERDVGAWSGLTVDEIEDAYPQAWQARMDDPVSFRPPDGENLADMGERCKDFVEALHASSASSIALVTHQEMSRVLLGVLLGLKLDHVVKVVHPNDLMYRVVDGGGEVSHYRWGEGPVRGLLHRGDGETIIEVNQSDNHSDS